MPKKKSLPEPEEPTYDVECINEARVTKKKDWEYNIKWGGYLEADNSWEPEKNLEGCRLIMRDFWEQVGAINKSQAKHFPVGHTLSPTKQWIKRTRETYEKKKMEESDEPEESDEEETALFENDESDEDDIPLSQKVASQTYRNASKMNVDKNSLSSKRKRSDTITVKPREPSPELPKKKIKAAPEFSSTETKEKETERAGPSLRDPLFDGDSDSDETPLASKSSTAALTTPTDSRLSQPQPSMPRPALSIDTSKLKEKSLPAHQQRKLNPRVKMMPLPTDANASSSGGISTKARIFSQGRSPTSAVPAGSPLVSSVPTSSPSVPGPSGATQSPGSTQQFDATKWLNEHIKPKEELVRIASTHTSQSPVDPSSSNLSSVAQQSLHFSKRWRWTGQLAVGDNESDDGFAEPVGGIVVTDNTMLDPKASQIDIHTLLSPNEDSICLRHQYSLATLQTALADFKISQFARMTTDPSDEDNAFDDLVVYMTKHELFSYAPLSIGESEVAKMFVFPASVQRLWDQLAVPAKNRQTRGLLVAVAFQAYEPPKRALAGFTETYHSEWKTQMKSEVASETRALDLSRALLALRFPDNLLKRLVHKECAVFTTPADKELAGPETLALDTILRSTPDCKLVPVLTGSARFIFIHVSAWDILHKLPGLVDRRLRRPDVQFYTYGSNPTVERKWWGVREVFPIGGVVTFTPRAIAEDPEGVERLIAKIDEHPLWTCYIIPSVVAMVVEISNADSGPNNKLKPVTDALCGILFPIEKGQIAMTWQPPPCTAWHRERDTDTDLQHKWTDWMVDQAHLSDLQGRELVSECQKRFRRSQDRLEKDVETRMVKDLLAMQSELREEYRRFVIITDTSGACNTSREVAASTSMSKADIKDGFEFTHVNGFTFNDDYYVDERK